ncbi:hypothetical protein PF004_g4298 [Phytophthora fragariae]|uniref:Uncharacterized protein n=1 Tax=Phytophthora fragariae TaxID=53985 RepID=A0A6G0PJ22_9STRA|nr:hypothetical protein PF004_g4298 [Phytophthora fragariae]
MAKPSLPLLTTVVTTAIVVCRECLPGYDVDSLSHVVGLLDGYLNTFSSNWTVPRACNAGLSLRALEYLTTRDPDWGDGKDAAYVAVTKKSLHVLKWLNECYPDRTSWGGLHGRCLLNKAAEVGDLSVLQWLHANRSEKCTAYAMRVKRASVVRPVQPCKRVMLSNVGAALRYAAENGHTEVVEWLYWYVREQRRGDLCIRDAVQIALKAGQTKVAKLLDRKLKQEASRAKPQQRGKKRRRRQ